MPVWAWVAVVAGAVVVLGAVAVAVVFGWRAYERRVLLRLVVRREAVEATASALFGAVERLAESNDEELAIFADDPDSVERRTLHEVETRGHLMADELDRMPLPRRFVPLAQALADASYMVGEQAAVVKDEDHGDVALDHLSAIDLVPVRAYIEKVRILMAGACDICGLDDTAVYGGGLYL